jgi:hypothetical protein
MEERQATLMPYLPSFIRSAQKVKSQRAKVPSKLRGEDESGRGGEQGESEEEEGREGKDVRR